jgi:hypothetical protein
VWVPEVGLSPAQWRQLGAAVRQLHAVPLTPQLTRMVAREAFRPTRRELLADVGALLATPARGEPVAGELAGFWRARQDVIGALVERADLLGRQLARRSFPQVLCHADLHTWNVLVDADQQLWIVDWDEAIVAPKERDMMFVGWAASGTGWCGPATPNASTRAMVGRASIHACWPTTAMPGRSRTSPPTPNRSCWRRSRPGAALATQRAADLDAARATIVFRVQVGSDDTALLIGVLKQLRRVLGGQKATLLWRDWLVVERMPPTSTRLRRCGPTSRATSWPTWPATPSARSSKRPGMGSSASVKRGGGRLRSRDALAC